MLDQILSRFGEMHRGASVKTAFGEPYQVNGRTIVPVAKVAFQFGFGGGRGFRKGDHESDPHGLEGGGGGGAGGGGRISVRPVAVLEIGDAKTTVRPIVDVTRIVVAAMALAAWNVFWISYTVRRVKAR
jgi:uncharacterized spore protein YtfJ